MTNPNHPLQQLIYGPLDLLTSLSKKEEHRRAYRTYLRDLAPDFLKIIVYGHGISQRWQYEYAMRELLNRESSPYLPDEIFRGAIEKTRQQYWSEHIRPGKLADWRERLASGEFYRAKAAENRDIQDARMHRARSTYKKKRDRRTHTIPDWVRRELRAEIRAARKAALLAGLDV